LARQTTEFLFYIPATSVLNGLNISMITGITRGDYLLMLDRGAITRYMQNPAERGRVGCMHADSLTMRVKSETAALLPLVDDLSGEAWMHSVPWYNLSGYLSFRGSHSWCLSATRF
jgi:hypothetical protein